MPDSVRFTIADSGDTTAAQAELANIRQAVPDSGPPLAVPTAAAPPPPTTPAQAESVANTPRTALAMPETTVTAPAPARTLGPRTQKVIKAMIKQGKATNEADAIKKLDDLGADLLL